MPPLLVPLLVVLLLPLVLALVPGLGLRQSRGRWQLERANRLAVCMRPTEGCRLHLAPGAQGSGQSTHRAREALPLPALLLLIPLMPLLVLVLLVLLVVLVLLTPHCLSTHTWAPHATRLSLTVAPALTPSPRER